VTTGGVVGTTATTGGVITTVTTTTTATPANTLTHAPRPDHRPGRTAVRVHSTLTESALTDR